jgi:hypothetical protein
MPVHKYLENCALGYRDFERKNWKLQCTSFRWGENAKNYFRKGIILHFKRFFLKSAFLLKILEKALLRDEIIFLKNVILGIK